MCNENPLAPLISYLGLRLYRTSDDNSVLYDHDLERYYLLFSRTCKIFFPCYFVLAPHCVCWSLCSYALFDKDGNQVPKETVDKVGETFERILEEVHSELIHALYFFFYTSWRAFLAHSMVSVALQTVKVRDEQEHDMPLLQAISIVFERHPHLKYFFLVPH